MVWLRPCGGGSILDPAPARSHAWHPGFAPLSVLFSLPAAFIIYRNIVRQTRVPPLPLPAAPFHTGTHTLPPLLLRRPASSVSSSSRPAPCLPPFGPLIHAGALRPLTCWLQAPPQRFGFY